PATTVIYTLSLHDALPIYSVAGQLCDEGVAAHAARGGSGQEQSLLHVLPRSGVGALGTQVGRSGTAVRLRRSHEAESGPVVPESDRKSTRLNSSHDQISYA